MNAQYNPETGIASKTCAGLGIISVVAVIVVWACSRLIVHLWHLALGDGWDYRRTDRLVDRLGVATWRNWC